VCTGSRVVAKTQTSFRKRRRGTCTHRGGRGLKMVGVSHDAFSNAEGIRMGGCVLTGAERKTPDELVRELHEVVKPKLYAYAYVERNP